MDDAPRPRGRPRKVIPAPPTAVEVEAEADRLAAALKRKKKLLADLAELGDDDEPSDAALPLPGSEKIEQIISELAGEGSFEISRLENGQTVRMGSYDLAAWPAAMDSTVRARGGGDYLIVFRHANGGQAARITRTYDQVSYPAAGSAKASGQGEETFLKFIEVMDRREAAHRLELQAMRSEMAKVQADSTKVLIETLRGMNKPLVSSLQDVVAVAGMFNKKTDPIEEYFKTRDLIDELRESDGPSIAENPLAGVLDKIARAVLPAIQAKFAPGAAPDHATTQPVAQVAALPPSPAPVPQEVKVPPPSIEPFVDAMVKGIEGGTTPEDAAEAVYQSVAPVPANCEAVKKLLSVGDWSAAYSHPFLSLHRPWLDAFRDALKLRFSAPAA